MNAALWLIAGVGIATVLGLIAKFRTQPTEPDDEGGKWGFYR